MENNDFFETDPLWEQENIPAPEDGLAKVKNLIKRHDQKTILKSVILIAGLILFVFCVLVPLTEMLHWSPEQYHYSENESDLKLTLEAYMELFHPGKQVNYVQSEKIGYATYDLRISVQDTGKEVWEKVEATMELSDLYLEAGFFDTDPRDGLPFRMLEESEAEKNEETLNQLPEYVTIRAAVTFPTDIDMAQLFQFWTDYTWSAAKYPLHLDWAAIRHCYPTDNYPICGISLSNVGAEEGINEYYPEFHISSPNPDGSALEQHFESILRYSSDQWEKGRGLDVWGSDRNYYDAVLDYIEENGMMCYGCIVSGSPQALLNLLEQGIVTQVRILDGWLDVQ